MNPLRNLTDDELHNSTIIAAADEREATINLYKHLAEVERRHLFSMFKSNSLHAYCVQFLQMSDAQAGRHISGARLMFEIPDIEDKVREGKMTLTSVCQANTFFRKEAANGKKFDREEKLELLAELEGQSTRKVEQILLSKSEQPAVHMKETVRQKTEVLTEIKLLIDEETLQKLNRLKEIHSHEIPNATFAQIVKKLAEMGVAKLDPDLKAKRAIERNSKPAVVKSNVTKALPKNCTPAPEQIKSSRHIPAAVKHEVWWRDKGQCTFTDPRTGQHCGSKKFIELDHIIPFAYGGEHTTENLRLRCRAHNQRHNIEKNGFERAFQFRREN